MEKKPTKKITTPKLVTFTLKAVIPTGSYANIQPEFTVEAKTIEEARAVVEPHIEDMYRKYLNYSERMNQIQHSVALTPVVEAKLVPESSNDIVSEAFTFAENALKDAATEQAFTLIQNRIKVSTKLTDQEKQTLSAIIWKG